MRLTLKDHRDAMVAMLANGNCPTSAARIAHAMHDVLSYLQNEPEAPVSHSERRAEATTPGLNDKLLSLDLEAHRKPQTVNQQVKELQSTVKHRDNTIKQLKENIQLLRDERAELTRQLEATLSLLECAQSVLATYPPDDEQLTQEHIAAIRKASPASALPDENFTNELFSPEGKEWIEGARRESLQAGVRKEDTQLPDGGWIEWHGGGCPVNPQTIVDCKRADGDEYSEYPASSVYWYDTGCGDSIIAYRVVKP